jgi:hypothetical protein
MMLPEVLKKSFTRLPIPMVWNTGIITNLQSEEDIFTRMKQRVTASILPLVQASG